MAPIVVLPYVRSLPARPTRRSSRPAASWGSAPASSTSSTSSRPDLNSSVLGAVTQLRLAKRPVYYAADVEYAFQPSHTVCDAAPFINAASLAKPSTLVEASGRREAGPAAASERAGYAAEARALATWSQTVQARPGDWDRSALRLRASCTREASGSCPSRPSARCSTRSPTRSRPAVPAFKPGAQVVFTFESLPARRRVGRRGRGRHRLDDSVGPGRRTGRTPPGRHRSWRRRQPADGLDGGHGAPSGHVQRCPGGRPWAAPARVRGRVVADGSGEAG